MQSEAARHVRDKLQGKQREGQVYPNRGLRRGSACMVVRELGYDVWYDIHRDGWWSKSGEEVLKECRTSLFPLVSIGRQAADVLRC